MRHGHINGAGGSGPAKTRGKLKITRADGTVEQVSQRKAQKAAVQTVRSAFERSGRHNWDP